MFVAALVAAAGLLALAGCAGGSGSVDPATKDATAACGALARSTSLTHLAFQDGHRLMGAAELGLAAASEKGNLYGNLGPPFQHVESDIQTADVSRVKSDVQTALAICKADKLPSTPGSSS